MQARWPISVFVRPLTGAVSVPDVRWVELGMAVRRGAKETSSTLTTATVLAMGRIRCRRQVSHGKLHRRWLQRQALPHRQRHKQLRHRLLASPRRSSLRHPRVCIAFLENGCSSATRCPSRTSRQRKVMVFLLGWRQSFLRLMVMPGILRKTMWRAQRLFMDSTRRQSHRRPFRGEACPNSTGVLLGRSMIRDNGRTVAVQSLGRPLRAVQSAQERGESVFLLRHR